MCVWINAPCLPPQTCKASCPGPIFHQWLAASMSRLASHQEYKSVRVPQVSLSQSPWLNRMNTIYAVLLLLRDMVFLLSICGFNASTSRTCLSIGQYWAYGCQSNCREMGPTIAEHDIDLYIYIVRGRKTHVKRMELYGNLDITRPHMRHQQSQSIRPSSCLRLTNDSLPPSAITRSPASPHPSTLLQPWHPAAAPSPRQSLHRAL